MRVPFAALAGALFLSLLGPDWSAAQVTLSVVDTVNDLRTHTYNTGTGATVLLQGWNFPGDGGGGTLVSAPSPNAGICMQATGKLTSGDLTITNVSPFPAGLTPGMGVTSTASGFTNGTIASYSVANQSITLASNPPTTNHSSAPLSFTGDNGGTTFVDTNGTGSCFTRINPTYSPKEWGALEDSASDDTAALQSWLNANQPHIAVPGNSIITRPLYCGGQDTSGNPITDGTIIQGSPTQGVAEDPTVLPTFLITAAPPGSSNPFAGAAMLVMPAGTHCAIHGVGLIASSPATGSTYNAVNADGKSNLIADHSYLSGGYNNVDSEGSGDNANLEVYDSSLNNATNDNAYIKTPNVKFVRNAVSGAGGDNIYFTNSDIVIADNIIQQAQGWGINANGANLMRINGNYFDNNGKSPVSGPPAFGAIMIDNSVNMTICGNTFHRSGQGAEGTSGVTTSHIYFAGTDDAVSLCGNVYYPGETTSAPIVGIVRPDYDYDVDPAAILTNITIADNPAQQNVAAASGPQNLGVFSPNAAILLAASANPQLARNSLTGFTMHNDTTVGTKVNIDSGTAADSTNSATISVPGGCSIDLAGTTKGLGALDQGSVHPNTTYYFFAVSAPGGGAPSCMASANVVPSFQNVTTAAYVFSQKVNTLSGSAVLYNAGGTTEGIASGGPINPLAGFAIGYEVSGANVPNCSPNCPRITSLSSYELPTGGSWTGSTQYLNVNAVTGVWYGMSVSDGTGNDQYIPQSGTLIPNGNYAIGVDGSGTSPCTPVGAPHCVTIEAPTNTGCASCSVYFGGNFTLALDTPANGSTPLGSSANIRVYAGLYRMIGVLYTDPSDTNVVPFTQDGDTFYLHTPVADINTTIGNADVPLQLPSLPYRIPVEWLGRCVSSAKVIVYTPGPSPGQPVAFPTVPGYDVTSATSTAARYQTYTDAARHIHARANAGGTTFQCMTDGWTWHRGR